MLKISTEEYRRHLQLLQARVEEVGLDVFIVTAFESIYYLTGAGFEPLERPFFLLVSPDSSKRPVLLVPKLDAEHLKKARNVEEIRSYWEYPAQEARSWPHYLGDLLGHAREVGVEPSLRQEIREGLQGYSVRVATLVEELRRIKTPAEVAMIRRTAQYADFGVEQLLSTSYSGATVAEGFARSSAVTRKIICEVKDFEPLTTKVVMATWAAPRSRQPHSIPDLRNRLGQGPHVALVLTRVNGYAAECERTYFTVPPTRDIRDAFGAMMEARRLALNRIRPGLSCAELDGKVNEFLSGEGYTQEDERLHRTGHGFGLGNHEAPWIAEGSNDVLGDNMVISIEPGIYLKEGGYRHSDTVLVTKEGCELLTRQPTDLETLTIRGWKPAARLRGWVIRQMLCLGGNEASPELSETS